MARSDTNHGFRLDLPKGWEDQTVHFFMGPDDSGTQHTLTVLVDHYLQTDDLEEYARSQTDQYLQSLPGAELVRSEQVVLDNGAPAWEAVCKTVPAENQIVFLKRVYVMGRRRRLHLHRQLLQEDDQDDRAAGRSDNQQPDAGGIGA